jgi:phosphoglucomutase
MNIEAIRTKAEAWTREPHDTDTRQAVQALLDNADTTDLMEAFHQDLVPVECAASWGRERIG